MSTTTATITAEAIANDWTVEDVTDTVTRFRRAGAIVLVTYTNAGAVRTAEFSPAIGEHNAIGARDAGKRETVLSWITAPAPVEPAHTARRITGTDSVAMAYANVPAVPADESNNDATNTKIVAAGLSYAYSESTDSGERAYFARRHDSGTDSVLDVYRVTAERDADASNPRDDDNLYAWTLTGGRDYLDIDEDDADGIGALWQDMRDKYADGVAYEIVRLVAKRAGGVVFPLDRNHDGSVSIQRYEISDGVTTVRPGSTVVQHESGIRGWSSHRFVERLYGSIDGIAYVSAARIADMMSAGATGATIAGNLKGEVSVYNSWASGDCYGAIVDRATVVAPDVDNADEISYLDFEPVESCWGYYGDDHGDSGLAEFAADTINNDVRERVIELSASFPVPLTCPMCGHVSR